MGIKTTNTYNSISEDLVKIIIDSYQNGISSEKIAKELNINGSTVCRTLKRNNIEIRKAKDNKKRLQKNDNWLDIIDDEYKAYFLGFMITDGTVHHKRDEASIAILDIDKEVLIKISNIIYGFDSVKYYKIKTAYTNIFEPDKYVAKLSFYGDIFKNNLIKHGCMPQKTFKTYYPEIPLNLHSHFIRGLIDGDGCISIGDRTVVNLVGTKELQDGLINVANDILKLDIHFTVYKDAIKHKQNIQSLSINRQKDVLKFLDYIYKDSDIYLNRKFEKYQEAKSIIFDKM